MGNPPIIMALVKNPVTNLLNVVTARPMSLIEKLGTLRLMEAQVLEDHKNDPDVLQANGDAQLILRKRA